MSIPTVPGSEQANTPVRNVPMEASALMAGRGSAAMGEALGNVSDVLGGYAQAEAKARTAMTLADADRLMRQSRSEFINGLQGDTNEEEWLPKWQQKQDEVKDAILSGNKVSPAARRQLKLMFTDWEGASNVEIQTMARRQLANRGHAKILLAVDEAERDGDEAGAARYLQAGVGGHLMFPEEAAGRLKQVKENVQSYQIRTGMVSDPVATLKDLDSGKFSAIKSGPRTTLRREVVTAVAKQQSAGRDELLERLDNGEVVPPDEIKAKEQGGIISAAGAKSVRARITSENLKTAREDAALSGEEIDQWDPATDDNPEDTARNLGDQIAALPPALRRPLARTIQSKVAAFRKHEQVEENPVRRDTMSRMREDPLLSGSKDIKELVESFSGQYVMTDAEVQRRFHKTRKEAVRDFQMKQALQLQRLREWFDAFPKNHGGKQPSDTEAEAYRQQIMLAPKIDAAAAQMAEHAQVDPEAMRKIQENLAAGRQWYEGSPMPVKVKAPDGRMGTIPASKLKEAVAAGYQIVQ